MSELDSFAKASCKWINSAVETVIGVNLIGARKATLYDTAGNTLPSGLTILDAPFVKITDGTNTANTKSVNGSYGLVTVVPSHISTANSTATVLTAGDTFIGTAEDITDHALIELTVIASHASVTDGLCVQFSHDGTNWDFEDCYTIVANTGKVFSLQCPTKYVRVKYTNGGTNQTYFRLQTVFKAVYSKPSSHRIADAISSQDDAELTKAVLTAENPSSTFINIGATLSGNLKTTDAENTLAIAKGEVVGSSDINKWGHAYDFDTTDGEVTVWDGVEDGTAWELMGYVFSTTAAIDSISSSSAADTGIDVTIVGLDSNWDEVTQTATLNGQTRVGLTTNLIRVYRAYNGNGTEFVGHIIIYENTALTAGVPTDKTKIRAIIHPDAQQTEMAVYTVPAGKTGYLVGGYCSTAGASKTSNYIIRFKTRLFQKIFRLQQKVSISDTGTSYIQFKYEVPQVLQEKTDLMVSAEITEAGVTGASVSAGFSIILVEN